MARKNRKPPVSSSTRTWWLCGTVGGVGVVTVLLTLAFRSPDEARPHDSTVQAAIDDMTAPAPTAG
ncbi:MAG: hypothetical protein ACYSUQ_11880, partial [Planctomycetota bacterium]